MAKRQPLSRIASPHACLPCHRPSFLATPFIVSIIFITFPSLSFSLPAPRHPVIPAWPHGALTPSPSVRSTIHTPSTPSTHHPLTYTPLLPVAAMQHLLHSPLSHIASSYFPASNAPFLLAVSPTYPVPSPSLPPPVEIPWPPPTPPPPDPSGFRISPHEPGTLLTMLIRSIDRLVYACIQLQPTACICYEINGSDFCWSIPLAVTVSLRRRLLCLFAGLIFLVTSVRCLISTPEAQYAVGAPFGHLNNIGLKPTMYPPLDFQVPGNQASLTWQEQDAASIPSTHLVQHFSFLSSFNEAVHHRCDYEFRWSPQPAQTSCIRRIGLEPTHPRSHHQDYGIRPKEPWVEHSLVHTSAPVLYHGSAITLSYSNVLLFPVAVVIVLNYVCSHLFRLGWPHFLAAPRWPLYLLTMFYYLN